MCLTLLAFWAFVGMDVRGVQAAESSDPHTTELLKELTDRVTILEKAVLDDPYQPKSTVLARLDAIERRLEGLDKSDNADAKGDDQAFANLRKELDQQQEEDEAIQKRIAALEQTQKSGGTSDRDMRDVERSIDQLRKSVDELAKRVKSLEAKGR